MLKVIALVATAIGVSSYSAKHMTKHIAKHAKPVHSVPPGVCDDWKMGQMWETPAAVEPCSDMIRAVTLERDDTELRCPCYKHLKLSQVAQFTCKFPANSKVTVLQQWHECHPSTELPNKVKKAAKKAAKAAKKQVAEVAAKPQAHDELVPPVKLVPGHKKEGKPHQHHKLPVTSFGQGAKFGLPKKLPPKLAKEVHQAKSSIAKAHAAKAKKAAEAKAHAAHNAKAHKAAQHFDGKKPVVHLPSSHDPEARAYQKALKEQRKNNVKSAFHQAKLLDRSGHHKVAAAIRDAAHKIQLKSQSVQKQAKKKIAKKQAKKVTKTAAVSKKAKSPVHKKHAILSKHNSDQPTSSLRQKPESPVRRVKGPAEQNGLPAAATSKILPNFGLHVHKSAASFVAVSKAAQFVAMIAAVVLSV